MNKVLRYSATEYDIDFNREEGTVSIVKKYASRDEWVQKMLEDYRFTQEQFGTVFHKVGQYLYCLDKYGNVGKVLVPGNEVKDIHRANAYAHKCGYPIYHGF